MRMPVLSLIVVLACADPAGAGSAVAGIVPASADLDRLERAWHGCLREAYARQPSGQSRAGDERNALDECRDREDAYVAAVLAAQATGMPGTERSLTARARSWAASVAAYVLDPVTAWLGVPRH